MASQDDFIRTALRVPPELHARIHASAKDSNRTFNAEIVARLEKSYGAEEVELKSAVQAISSATSRLEKIFLSFDFEDEVRARAAKQFIASEEKSRRMNLKRKNPESKK